MSVELMGFECAESLVLTCFANGSKLKGVLSIKHILGLELGFVYVRNFYKILVLDQTIVCVYVATTVLLQKDSCDYSHVFQR